MRRNRTARFSNMVYLIALSFMVMVCDLGHGLILWLSVSWINFLCCKFTKIIERVFKCNILYGKGFLFMERVDWGDESESVCAPATKGKGSAALHPKRACFTDCTLSWLEIGV